MAPAGVDTSVLLDIFGADLRFGSGSAEALRLCLSEGRVVACDVVWGETVAWFPSSESAMETLDRLGFSSAPWTDRPLPMQ